MESCRFAGAVLLGPWKELGDLRGRSGVSNAASPSRASVIMIHSKL